MSTEHSGFQRLVRQAQDGDRAAMDRVLDTIRPHIEPLARLYADPAQPAESSSDLLQESCLRAWQRLGTFRGGEGDERMFEMFRAWIGQIVRRLGQNALRDRKAQRRRPPRPILPLHGGAGAATTGAGAVDPPARQGTPSAHARAEELNERIEALLRGLPDGNAAVARMHFFEGRTFAEIADRTGMTYHQVRDRYLATMRLLEKELDKWI